MKTLLCLFIGIILGALGWDYYQRTYHPTLAERTGQISDAAREKAADLKDKVADEAKAVSAPANDAKIITLVKGKYLIDRDLSVLSISVDCQNGDVVLKGSVASDDLIKRAVDLAWNTGGVRNVRSELTVARP